VTDEPELRGTVVVLSPHLDDGVLSLGVFAGDPESAEPPDAWNARCGFESAGAAARGRRDEDRRALELLGAEPVWLPLEGGTEPETLRQALEGVLRGAETVLVPGSPCKQEDHLTIARAVLERPPAARLGLYVDQPYAVWQLLESDSPLPRRLRNGARLALRLGSARAQQEPELPAPLRPLVTRPLSWLVLPSTREDRRRKARAIRAYTSQTGQFGPRLVPAIALYERCVGGESLAWL
jgi:LmbE family N-acetylglucosaminyl deacetylase